jgi:ribosomal protein S18 acetylase RimI-like enzyme
VTSSFAAEALRAYDEQVRRDPEPVQPDWVMELAADGRVLRSVAPGGLEWGSFICWSDLHEADADEVIAEQVAFYRELGRPFEWKWHGYDEPVDLPARLIAAGLEPDEEESLVIGSVEAVVAATEGAKAAEGVTFRHLNVDDADADFAGIATLMSVVWDRDSSDGLISHLRTELAAKPEHLLIHLAEADGKVVCAAWVRFHAGTEFASLWGGSTLEEWRRKGIYRALVARRAQEAAARGYRYLQVDASDDSLPILQRLGLQKVAVTTPYNWKPAS